MNTLNYRALQPLVSVTSRVHFYNLLMHRADELLSFHILAKNAARIIDQSDLKNQEDTTFSGADAFRILADPLRRSGILNFRGNGKYQLSPSCCFIDFKGNIVSFNAPYPPHHAISEEISQGVLRISNTIELVDTPEVEFDALALLRSMLPINKLISQSPVWTPHSHGIPKESWQILDKKKGWTDQKSSIVRGDVEIYKQRDSVHGEQYLWLEGELYYLPSRKLNPDAWELSHLVRDCMSDNQQSIFTLSERKLTINNRLFPAALEQICWNAELLESGRAVDTSLETRVYQLNPILLTEFKRILLQ